MIARPRSIAVRQLALTATSAPRAIRSTVSGSSDRPSRVMALIDRTPYWRASMTTETRKETRHESVEHSFANERCDRFDLARKFPIIVARRDLSTHQRMGFLDRTRGCE